MRCPKCGAQEATKIMINLTDDDSVGFFHCRRCEGKWWERDGVALELDEVLDLTHKSESK